MIATISRAVINIFNTLITPRIVYAILDRTDCFYGKDFKVETVIFTITYIFMGDILMHFVPIYLIRSMYQPPSWWFCTVFNYFFYIYCLTLPTYNNIQTCLIYDSWWCILLMGCSKLVLYLCYDILGLCSTFIVLHYTDCLLEGA